MVNEKNVDEDWAFWWRLVVVGAKKRLDVVFFAFRLVAR